MSTVEYLEEFPVTIIEESPEWHVLWVVVILFFMWLLRYLCFSGKRPPVSSTIKHAND
jgi:hypothetical protein